MRLKLKLFLILSYWSLGQQTPNYSQFMFEKNFYNPAYIGISQNSVEGTMSYKLYLYDFSPDASYKSSNELLESINKPQLITNAIHGASKKRNMALGFRFELDKQPFLTQNYLTSYISKRKKIGFNKLLSLGVEIGIRNTALNQNNIKLISQNDDALKTDNPRPFNYLQPDFGLGMYFCNPKYNFGLSIKNILGLKYSWTENFKREIGARNYPLLFASGGYKYKLNDLFILEGNLLYKAVFSNLFNHKTITPDSRSSVLSTFLYNDLSMLDLNGLIEYDKTITLGASYRTNKTIVALARFRIADRIYISYAYDIALRSRNTMSNSFKGNHELLINYLVDFGSFVDKSIDPRYY